MKVTVLLAGLLFGCFGGSVLAADLEPISIHYTVSMVSEKLGNATLGKLATSLIKTESGYTVNSQTKAQGLAAILMGSNIEENCHFSVKDERLVSQTYSGGKKKQTDYDVSFDWPNRKVSFDAENSLDMPQGYVVDNCNLPFAAALSKGQNLDAQTLYVVDGKKQRIRGYTLKSTSDEKLNTPIGQMNTIKVVLQREFKPQRTLTLWLALDKSYVPVKMEEKRESRTTTMLVSQLNMI